MKTRLLLVLAAAFVSLACEKEIHEARVTAPAGDARVALAPAHAPVAPLPNAGR